MTINGIEITVEEFAYDGCHKIYLLEDDNDKYDAIKTGYSKIFPISELEHTYQMSCPLRFINTWDLKSIVPQCETAVFKD